MSIKTSPYYSTVEEKKQQEEAVKAFGFDDIPEVTNKLIVIAGPEGSGKTHLACSMSEINPVYVLDTEYRAVQVTKKFQDGKFKVKHKVCRNYPELVIAAKAILKRATPGTIVIDSGSDLQTFAEIYYLHRTKMDKVYPMFNWSEVWTLCNALIDEIKFSPFNLVVTARVKEEYIGDKPSGRIIPRLYNTLPYKADLGIQFQSLSKPGWIWKPQTLDGKTQPFDRILSLPQFLAAFEEQMTKEKAHGAEH